MLFRTSLLTLGAVVALTGCASQENANTLAELETRVAAMEAKVESGAGAAGARPPARRPGQAGVDPEKERAAAEQIKAAIDKADAFDFEGAKEICAQAAKEYGATQTFQQRGRVCQEVEVIGKDAMDLEVDKWFQGEASMGDAPATLLVFWEQWCPHCKREVPLIEQTYNDNKGKLNVIGLTKVNRSATDDKVAEFITEKGITYPIAKEKAGSLSRYYNVSGVPAAALVKDGKVVWRGPPAVLNRDNNLDKLLNN